MLRCATCGRAFSELKGTALWNTKIPHEQAESIVEHVTRGHSFKETGELTHTHRTTVSRLACTAGEHAARVHDHHAQDLQVTSLQADERHGFVGRKDQPCQEATVIDPRSKFLIQNALGARTTDLANRVHRGLLRGAVIHTFNWAEVLSKLAERGLDPETAEVDLSERGVLGQTLAVDTGQPGDARTVAALRPVTRGVGLSLGDRYCLALGTRLGWPVLTANRAWATLHLAVTVELLR